MAEIEGIKESQKGPLHTSGNLAAGLVLRRTGPVIALKLRIRSNPPQYLTLELNPHQAEAAIYLLRTVLNEWQTLLSSMKDPAEI